ncbi:arylsulfatase B [Manduca sexta]|uniref:Sulfatase N-terminal domain-containing protein n=1 Tax=Manduca sexta TaxID=7130 RepID=A0A922CLY0_MANSE|nr:arylsulfatase B [Manduca sexta]KAG6450906.1 hypothetical protein O3G_MSEX006823 [Manduca sexta]KAG6450907.1 hypothetical protein O3G_MSEX006823 [Manduca sexta]
MLPKLLYSFALIAITLAANKPHIVFIVADDLGRNDVSFHGSDQIMTPNIDIIGYEGIIIEQYYTDAEGTASRSALFTGKYSMRLGMQGVSISVAEDRGVPVSERLLPSYLQELGYTTHLVGKWQLGNSREDYFPTKRGFDTFRGFVSGGIDYNNYYHVERVNDTEYFGLDFFNNLEPFEKEKGYLTDVLTNHAVQIIRDHDTSTPLYLHVAHAAPHVGGGSVNLQATEDSLEENIHIAHPARKLYAGMVTSLDRSIGRIVAALAEREMLDSTILIFISDNGAASTGDFKNYGSNYPLRGTKGTPWEGAVKSTAIVWQNSMIPQIWPGLFHVTDWLPTLVAAAGGNIIQEIDGINQWNALISDEIPKRTSALITIDDLNGWAAYRDGDFKLIIGDVDADKSDYYGELWTSLRKPPPSYERALLNSETAQVFREILDIYLDVDAAIRKRNELNSHMLQRRKLSSGICKPTNEKGCLFNITEDPFESQDLWLQAPEIVRYMVLRIRYYWSQLNPRRQPKFDHRSNPALREYVWLPWVKNNKTVSEELVQSPQFPLIVSVGELQYLVDYNLNMFSDKVSAYIKGLAATFMDNMSGLFLF